MLGKFAGAGRTENLVHRQRMAMSDEVDSRQIKKPGMEHGFDARLLSRAVMPRAQQRLLDLAIRKVLLVQQRQERGNAADGNILRRERRETGAARLDGESLLREFGGGVALAKDGHLPILPADGM